MKVYLIRHAEEGKGGSLSRKGQEQALDLARWLGDKSIRALYSSDRKRAQETAEIAAPTLELESQVLPRMDEVREVTPMESLDEARERVEGGFLHAVGKNQGRNIVLVLHSKLIRQLLDKLDLRRFVEGEYLPNPGIVVLDSQEGKFKLLDYALVP